MSEAELTKAELNLVDELVRHYVDNRSHFERIIASLESFAESSSELKPLVHSYKRRTKDPKHLQEKLVRKMLEAKAKGKILGLTKDNIFVKINDLAGFRIIHLHTRQIERIDKVLQEFFTDERWKLKEGPTAKTWDDEARKYFSDLGFKIDKSDNMYTSVHYVVQPNKRSQLTCEIQVRTLMEEVWGEVDHTINYPAKSKVLTCREQIKVLARMTSSCSRLVDSIFLSSANGNGDPTPAEGVVNHLSDPRTDPTGSVGTAQHQSDGGSTAEKSLRTPPAEVAVKRLGKRAARSAPAAEPAVRSRERS